MQGEAANLNDGSHLRFGVRNRLNNLSVAAGGAGRDSSSMGVGNMRQGTLSPGNLTSANAGGGLQGGGDHFQFDKTGAPVNILMAPEQEDSQEGNDIL